MKRWLAASAAVAKEKHFRDDAKPVSDGVIERWTVYRPRY